MRKIATIVGCHDGVKVSVRKELSKKTTLFQQKKGSQTLSLPYFSPKLQQCFILWIFFFKENFHTLDNIFQENFVFFYNKDLICTRFYFTTNSRRQRKNKKGEERRTKRGKKNLRKKKNNERKKKNKKGKEGIQTTTTTTTKETKTKERSEEEKEEI